MKVARSNYSLVTGTMRALQRIWKKEPEQSLAGHFALRVNNAMISLLCQANMNTGRLLIDLALLNLEVSRRQLTSVRREALVSTRNVLEITNRLSRSSATVTTNPGDKK